MTSEYVVLGAGLAVGAGAAVVIRYALELAARRSSFPAGPPPGAAISPRTPDLGPAEKPSSDPPKLQKPSTQSPSTEFRATVRRSEQVILHLYAQGRWGPGETVPPSLTQAGIGSAVGSAQSALAKTLSRLGAAGVVEVELRHVRGATRRFKIYRLTPIGESLARSLREVEARRLRLAPERPHPSPQRDRPESSQP
jgi:hypothetical protein